MSSNFVNVYHTLFFCQEAENSIRFYQNLSNRDEELNLLESEITKLKTTVGAEDSEKSEDKSFKWSDVATNPGKMQ